MRVRPTLLILCSLACAALAGCGGGGVSVDGKAVNGSTPYPLAEGEGVSVTMTSADGKTVGSGTVQKDSTFTIKVDGDKPLPEGKYKVSITHYKPAPAAGKKPTGPPAPVTKPYPEEWDVSASSKSFTLDMSKIK